MVSHGLELAHHKSEAVILTNKRAYTPPRLRIGGHPIELRREIRYFGVRLDTRLTFRDHVQIAAKKAIASATALGKIMLNIKGPGQWKRRLLATAV